MSSKDYRALLLKKNPTKDERVLINYYAPDKGF